MASYPRNVTPRSLSDELLALAPEGYTQTFQPNQVIFAAGDPGDGVYVIQSGRVRISGVVGDHEPRVLATIGSGDFFGEMAVVDDAPRSGTATAEVETKAVFIERERLLELIDREPHLARSIIREFSIRMRTLNLKYLDEIVQAERLAAVGRFAGTIVHDFKNPLTVISMAAEIAAMDSASPAMRRTAQERIHQQVTRMSNMLGELIEFTKPSGHRPTLAQMNFAAFMKPLAGELREEIAERRVQLELQNQPPEISVRIEPQRLSRLFFNLTNNAVDEMPGGGKLFLRFFPGASELRIEVEDTGKGISPEIAPLLFQPFATHGKTKGTGLGLSICRRIVEDHGGKIWTVSTPGKGAIFVFTLSLNS
jgi:signal transduction histidine kinase